MFLKKTLSRVKIKWQIRKQILTGNLKCLNRVESRKTLMKNINKLNLKAFSMYAPDLEI